MTKGKENIIIEMAFSKECENNKFTFLCLVQVISHLQ